MEIVLTMTVTSNFQLLIQPMFFIYFNCQAFVISSYLLHILYYKFIMWYFFQVVIFQAKLYLSKNDQILLFPAVSFRTQVASWQLSVHCNQLV